MTKPRVLVVEDNFLFTTDLTSVLERIGFVVVGPCASLAAALELLQIAPIEIALIDYHIGEAPSEELAKRLDQMAIPFAFCTGTAPGDLARQFRATPIIPKPYTAYDVERVANSLMAARLKR